MQIVPPLQPHRVRIREARGEEDLRLVALLRLQGYGRHLPQFAQSLCTPEAADLDGTATVLLAECESSGRLLGTVRMQDNRTHALPVEHSALLPPFLQGCALAEPTRLALTGGRAGECARLELFRHLHRMCLRDGIDWIVVSARPPVDRLYRRLVFRDVRCEGADAQGLVSMSHVGGIAHRVMALPVRQAKRLWLEQGHPLLEHMTKPLSNDTARSVRAAPVDSLPEPA